MLYSFLRSKNGFTLVELMIVVSIMSILVAVAVPLYISSENTKKKQDCDSQCVIIDSIVRQAMSGMLDNGKRQRTIDFSGIQSDHYVSSGYPGDGKDGTNDDKYVGKPCFVLNSAKIEKTTVNGSDYIINQNPLLLKDIRGGHRSSCSTCSAKNLSYSEGCWGIKKDSNGNAINCSKGHFLKKANMENTELYVFFANQEIPVCPFADAKNSQKYYYFIVVDDKGTTINSKSYSESEKRDRVWELDDEIVVLCNCPECNKND